MKAARTAGIEKTKGPSLDGRAPVDGVTLVTNPPTSWRFTDRQLPKAQNASHTFVVVTSDVTNATRLVDGESAAMTLPAFLVMRMVLGPLQMLAPISSAPLAFRKMATTSGRPLFLITTTAWTRRSVQYQLQVAISFQDPSPRPIVWSVLGDFQPAVKLFVSERSADTVFLSVKGGLAVLQRAQKAYFDRQANAPPYLRLFAIMPNADLKEWHIRRSCVCRQFSGLAELLGRRQRVIRAAPSEV
jgi:hypothetical protein